MGKEQKPASPVEAKKQTKPETHQGTEQHHGQNQSRETQSGSRGNTAEKSAKIGCGAQGCKAKDERFGFCGEHFRQFKFGLINKSGEPAFDYDRKFDHYQKWKQAQKAA